MSLGTSVFSHMVSELREKQATIYLVRIRRCRPCLQVGSSPLTTDIRRIRERRSSCGTWTVDHGRIGVKRVEGEGPSVTRSALDEIADASTTHQRT
jgi:hypothetical protein